MGQVADRGVIETEEDIAKGVRALRRKCQHMRRVHDLVGNPPLRRRAGGFTGLVRIVVGQQLSISSAAAIWSRVESGVVPFDPDQMMSLSEDALRSFGLSRSKITTIRSLAAAVLDGTFDVAALDQAQDQDIHKALTGLRGFGPWSADIYIMFCLGRRDGFAAGDLALQEGVRLVMDLEERPTAAQLLEISERWRPWRGVAARLLWAHYGIVKKISSATPA